MNEYTNKELLARIEELERRAADLRRQKEDLEKQLESRQTGTGSSSGAWGRVPPRWELCALRRPRLVLPERRALVPRVSRRGLPYYLWILTL